MRNLIFSSLIFSTLSLFSGSKQCGCCAQQIAKIGSISKDSLISLNARWEYLEKNLPFEKVQNTIFDQKINLPHSWNKTDAMDPLPGYRRDGSWYKKLLEIKGLNPDLNYKFYFEGSNITTKVYINGQKAGEHIGGYVGFEIDATSKLKKGKNEILIWVDNSVNKEVIPSQKADFFIYGGITRDLWLKVSPKNTFEDIYPFITHIGENKFNLSAKVKIASNDKLKMILSYKGKEISSKEFSNSNTLEINELKIDNLWSVDSPNLYDLTISQMRDNQVVYLRTEKIGFRYFEFKTNGGFYLNGQRLLLRGTHRHEEHAGLAAALPNAQHRKDMEDIKGMGANFIRLAHYPQDPEVYRACDELGLLVWDELPWCRGGVGNETWKNTAKRLLEEQINQNLNHPSIILWSMGNEMYWDPDFEGGGEIKKNREFLTELVTISKRIDPTRPTSIRKFYEGADVVDVFSPSIWAGWYRGEMTEYTAALDEAFKNYPRFLHMEYGADSHFGRHDEDLNSIKIDAGWEEDLTKVGLRSMANNGTWSESYAVELFDYHLFISEKYPDFAGSAQWIYKDFGTPLRPENPIPYMNQKGLCDREGNPKDAYYVYKSYWNEKDAFVYIQSHTWLDRFGAEGEVKKIRVYSNCNDAELFLNGVSLGKKNKDKTQFPAHGLVWEVKFQKGKNILTSTGTLNGKLVKDEIEIEYHTTKGTKPNDIHIEAEQIGSDTVKVTASVIDSKGNICPEYRKKVYGQLNGGGKLISDLGLADASSIVEPSTGKAIFYILVDKNQEGIFEVRNQDFKGVYLKVPLK